MDSTDILNNITVLKELRALEERLRFLIQTYHDHDPNHPILNQLKHEQAVVISRLDQVLDSYASFVTI